MANGVRRVFGLFVVVLVLGLMLSAASAGATRVDVALAGMKSICKAALLTGTRLRLLQAAIAAVFAASLLSLVDKLVNKDDDDAWLSGARQWLRQARDGVQLMAAVLLLTTAGQLTWIAGEATLARLDEPDREKLLATPKALVTKAMKAVDIEPKEEAPPPTPEGSPIHVMLSVSHKGPRSKVLINGSFIGYTTYMADISCLRGETLQLSIVPPKGRRIDRASTCEGPTLVFSQ